MFELLRSRESIAAQMKALRESIENDFKKNTGALRPRRILPSLQSLGPHAALRQLLLRAAVDLSPPARATAGGRQS
jgi:hypothetical protein